LIVELLSIAAIFAGGCLFVRSAGLTGWAVPAFGLLAGICVQLAVGSVQVVTGLPTWPALTLALTAGLPALWWLVRWRRGHDVSLPLPYAVLSLALLAGAVTLLRATNMVKWHIDSYTYLMTSSMLANGTYHEAITPVQATKRLLGIPVLHAPAQLSGEFYLQSITPLLAVATLAALVWLFRAGTGDRVAPARLAGFAVLAVLLLVSLNRFVFSAFYINGHLLTGALIMVVAGCGWLLMTRHDRALMALQLIAIPALVVTRPEGTILAGLALLPTVLSRRIAIGHRAALLAALGTSTAGWQLSVVWIYRQYEEDVPVSVAGTLAVGVLLVVLAGLLRYVDRLPRPLWIAEAGLWLALAAFTAREPDILADSLRATMRNAVEITGRWGMSLVVLAGLVVVAIGLAWQGGSARRLTSLRFAVTTFLPVAYLLAYLRDEGAYRVGQYDSLSRMFMQVLPVAVLFVVTVYATVSQRELETGADDAARDAGRGDRQPHPEVHSPEPGDPVADHAVGRPAGGSA
jgi:hypothetical protein